MLHLLLKPRSLLKKPRSSARKLGNLSGCAVEMTNSVKIVFKLIPPGEFWMGESQEKVTEMLQGLKPPTT